MDVTDPMNNALYVSSANSVSNVGQELADILNKVRQPNQKIHCIGHSLGKLFYNKLLRLIHVMLPNDEFYIKLF